MHCFVETKFDNIYLSEEPERSTELEAEEKSGKERYDVHQTAMFTAHHNQHSQGCQESGIIRLLHCYHIVTKEEQSIKVGKCFGIYF